VVAALLGTVVVALLAGCAAGSRSPAPVTSAPPAAGPTPTELARSGCPVDDADFCPRAVIAANSLLTGTAADLLEVSAVETFTCDDMPAGMVSACGPGAVLTGHGVYSEASKITVVDPDDYPRWLDDLFGRVDAGYSDGRGSGRPGILGVGTCGPDDPDRRSYHVVFTVALRDPAGQAVRRWLGSVEFVRREGRWVTPLMYLDTVDAWRAVHGDPLRDIGCGNLRPWRT
jgi:hypothetical protein